MYQEITIWLLRENKWHEWVWWLMPAAEAARTRVELSPRGRAKGSPGQLASTTQGPSTSPQGFLCFKCCRKWDPSHELQGARAEDKMRKYSKEEMCHSHLGWETVGCFWRLFCRKVKEIKCGQKLIGVFNLLQAVNRRGKHPFHYTNLQVLYHSNVCNYRHWMIAPFHTRINPLCGIVWYLITICLTLLLLSSCKNKYNLIRTLVTCIWVSSDIRYSFYGQK